MNGYDTLLEWASELGAGSWRAWRDTCTHLRVEPNSAARKLAALGHVEFDWVDDRFAVAPPTAVLTLRSSGCLLLTGARRRGLRERLERLYEEEEFDIDLRDPVPQERGPATWLIESELDEMKRFCDAAGLELEVDSGRRIAEAMPIASLDRCGEEGAPDPRFARQWFNPKLGLFETNVPPTQSGLWWVREDRRAIAFIRRDRSWYRIPTREYGPYLAYPKYSFINYRGALNALSVENQAPLPPLVARAVTLQSGRLAKRDGRWHTYVNVDEPLAELIQTKLDTPLDWN